MALTVHKPTSPGQRGKVTVKRTGLYKGRPEASLTEKKSKSGGRNNYGRITTRHLAVEQHQIEHRPGLLLSGSTWCAP